MIVKLLTVHHLEFLSLNGGCRGSSESTLVKMSDCWKSHVMVQIRFEFLKFLRVWSLWHIHSHLFECAQIAFYWD